MEILYSQGVEHPAISLGCWVSLRFVDMENIPV